MCNSSVESRILCVSFSYSLESLLFGHQSSAHQGPRITGNSAINCWRALYCTHKEHMWNCCICSGELLRSDSSPFRLWQHEYAFGKCRCSFVKSCFQTIKSDSPNKTLWICTLQRCLSLSKTDFLKNPRAIHMHSHSLWVRVKQSLLSACKGWQSIHEVTLNAMILRCLDLWGTANSSATPPTINM